MLAAVVALLAQAAPTAPATPSLNVPLDDPRYFIVAAVLSIPLLVTAVNGILQIIKFFRPDPPTHREYATKGELRDVETRLTSAMTADSEALTEMEERINTSRNSMEHRIREELVSVTEKVDRGNTSLQNELKTIHRQLGEISGTLGARPRR